MSTRSREAIKMLLRVSTLLACAFLAKAPPALACECAVSHPGKARIISSDEFAFVGKLVEVRHEPNPNAPPPPSYWDAFMQHGLRGVWERFVFLDLKRHDQTVYVFDGVRSINEQRPHRLIVIDDSRYGTDCDSGHEPDFSKAIGKTVRVLARQSHDADSPSATGPQLRVSFYFCSGAPFEVM